jgi:hypothetical protein
MKTFLDLQATKTDIQVCLRLRPVCAGGIPVVCVRGNDFCLHQGPMPDLTVLSFSSHLLGTLTLSIELRDKQYDQERDTGIEIESLLIDDFEIVPTWTGLATYRNELDLSGPTSYIGANGVWQIAIQEPFYTWRHHVTGQGWLLSPNQPG